MSLTARASLALISLSLLAACSNSSATDGTPVQADCGAIELRPALIVVEGADYDALGQWTDETIKQTILTRLELVEA